jgi:hypothetical protein
MLALLSNDNPGDYRTVFTLKDRDLLLRAIHQPPECLLLQTSDDSPVRIGHLDMHLN